MTAATSPPPVHAAATLAEVEAIAQYVLPADRWDFVAGGAGEEVTLEANRQALLATRLAPRVLADVSALRTDGGLLGYPARMPAAIAPMAFHRLVHPAGELATAEAAAEAGIPFTATMMSSVTLEEIAATGAVTWFQLYWLRDRGLFLELVARAERAGCAALVLTADMPVMGTRPRDVRNGFTLPPDVVAANLGTAGAGETLTELTGAAFDPSLSWADLAWLRGRTRLPIVLKGVLSPEDGTLAVAHGADAIVVSNHGGRQLDGAIAAADALPAVREAVGTELPVLFDSGVRSGTDVLRALALGADGVLLGRPVLHGLAAGGCQGVGHVLAIVLAELTAAMALAGCPDLAAVRRLRTVRAPGP